MTKDGKATTSQAPRRPLPAVPDPYDMAAKKALNPKADKLNFIDDKGRLVCGARKKHGPGFCRSIAGMGTAHKGYGRCKFCGGCNTGPKTPEGKAKVAQNPRKHGLYSDVLSGYEKEKYEQMLEDKHQGLEHEILMVKAKILAYLEKWNKIREEGGEVATRVWYTAGIDQQRAYYFAGSADDRVLLKALDQLRRLVDSQAKLNPEGGDGLLDAVNAELRAASQGRVTLAWNTRRAQARARQEGEGDNAE